MKILISDYAESMMPQHDLETETLKSHLGEDIDVEVYAYTDEAREEFYEHPSSRWTRKRSSTLPTSRSSPSTPPAMTT